MWLMRRVPKKVLRAPLPTLSVLVVKQVWVITL